MKDESIKSVCDRVLMNTYGPRQATFVKGEGSYLWDENGKKYLDMVAGIAVSALGHCHRVIVDAVRAQAGELIHASNLYYVKPQAELAELLVSNSFAERVFFANSGAEANEAAIKIARKFGAEKSRYEIITMEGSFHGRTLATLTATGQEKVKTGFAPFPRGFKTVEFNNLKATAAAAGDKTAAVMLEPIQGERGNRVSTPGFIKGLRDLCDRKNILLIFDEVQCGMGRTGTLFAYEHYGVVPDVMTLAKPLGGGLPLGAVLAGKAASDIFIPGSHGSTFGGNPVACAAGFAMLSFMLEKNLIPEARSLGDYLLEGLRKLQKKHKFIKEVRGRGLMAGFELSFPGKDVAAGCFERGLLVNCTSENFIRFLPPLTVSRSEIDDALGIVDDVLKSVNPGSL
jgi:acetylornithine/N-succinyldiaminopimelate aminotransferase